MTSPIPPNVSERESVLSRLALPSARVLAATVILITGAGVAAVFWKMPKANELHPLSHDHVAGTDLVAVPLPSDAIAAVTPDEEHLLVFSAPDFAPVVADGVAQYGQVYQAPAPLARGFAEGVGVVEEREASVIAPTAPQKFEPMRDILEDKPISVEPISREFAPMPTSVSTTERSDELLARFHFVVNDRAERSDLPELPTDLFPIREAPSVPVVSTLQPLPPVQRDHLFPLIPFRDIELQPLVVQ